ncbi:MAG: hypothetical protein JWN76_3780 [Chitinophagaceae bacterium]|nr:hypothetical protein [Chitinophagaceae bacterium]
MSLLNNNNKKGSKQSNKSQGNQAGASKFIKGSGSSSKPAGAVKKVRSTGANRGS